MLRTGGTVAVSIGALLTAGSMNLAVLNGGPTGPGNLVIRAAAAPTTSPRAHGRATATTATDPTTSTTAARRRALLAAASASTTAPSTTTSSSTPDAPTTTSTRPPVTTTTQPQTYPQGGRLFTVRDAGHVRVQWVNGHTISAVALPNDGWSLPHASKQGPDVTLRFQSSTELVVWHAWVEAHQIKAWIHTYQLAG